MAITNFIVDWNNDLMYISTPENGYARIWNESPAASSQVQITTKDFDFGEPGRRKSVYMVKISYKGDADSLTTKFSVNGDTDTLYQFNSDNTPLTDITDLTAWAITELEPSTPSQARNIYSFQLHMDGTLGGDFELNDITIVYRLKGTR